MDNITNFLVQGYYLDTDTGIDFSLFKDKEFADCNYVTDEVLDEKNLAELKSLQRLFADKYLSKLFINFETRDCGMWEGVDPGSAIWHNDYLDGDNFNSNILVYLDDNTEENGNSIEVRGPGFSHKLYPKEGNLLWLNQRKIFQHKATHNTGRRRVLSFEYFIKDLA